MRKSASLFFLFVSALAAVLLLNRGTFAADLSASGEKIVGGPYVVDVGPRAATLMWLVQTGQASVGTEPGKLDKTSPILRAERTSLRGLQPGKTYYYQAFPGEAGKGSFKTAPSSAADFEFVVYGDTRTRHDVHRAVISAVLKYAHPDFIMHTGDLVAEGSDTSLWPIFFDVERELLRVAPIFPALGNHERNARNYYDFMDAQAYYSFNWGSAHFTVINSDIENAGSTKAEKDAFWLEQTRWLEADLQDAQSADFRFLFAHHPPITAVRRRQGENAQMTALEPMLEKYKVSAGFFGHDHNYQHYLKNGVHYFTTGGGGAPLYDVDLPPDGITKKVESTENFIDVKVTAGKAHLEAFKPNGDTVEISDLTK
jgi:hypothetical protein